MKKILIVSSVLAVAAASAMAQGTLNLNNAGSTLVQVQDPTLNGGAPVATGKAATTAGFTGAGPAQVTIEMFAALSGTLTLAQLEATTPVFTGLNSPSTISSGLFNGGNPYALPTASAFDGTHALDIIFYGITTGGKYAGFSNEAIGITPGVPPAGNAATVFGSGPGLINSFVLTPVPEPSTIVLGGLGAAALLAFRRRK